MAELLLDSAIRVWVILPIVMITFFVGIIRHYLSILLQTTKKLELEQVSDSQVLLRSKLLREHGCYIPLQAFQMRRHFFNDEEEGFFKTQKRKGAAKNPISDPTMMVDMAKGNITNVLPMIIIGGWINWQFSGFITTKVPFPLTIRFKAMLQRGIDLVSLNASWVSSVSWYFINVFGLRSMYSLVLGENNAADSTRAMQEQMQMSGGGMPPDPAKAFKAEWEALEIITHEWRLSNVEEKLMEEYVNDTFLEKDKHA
ncbi:ER membrane protein complex subunit 3-like isoform X2 [Xenia sp. Carnegie-2017]|uniref:ER membrane protein complex subunit 3-like isoform X2 n=1 Tax=Xenia sp. Carnegie-2017 TaxID=2897299 RepID=UPI001F04521F|nr:ER membrane protein complex subunit 3-like isoform X2 [Xenia sp. Carnegie-2017]XP_046853776.1 ER membrane protein complex subunit 3-like isoform X2 [Xenia sp. Carnegie-2017]